MAGRGSMPTVRWDPQVEAYFSASFGPSRLAAMSSTLARPSLRPAIRVNTLRTTPDEVVRQLRELLPPGADPRVHPRVPGVVVLRGHGPRHVNYPPGMAEVVINRFAGEAVLKGANVYAPGLLAASPGISPGDRVAVSIALERPQPARRRGGQVPGRQQQQQQEEEGQQCGGAVDAPGDGDLEGSVAYQQEGLGWPTGASGGISDSDCSTARFSTSGSTSSSSSGGQGTGKEKRRGGGSGGTRWVVGINRGSLVEQDGSVRLVGGGPARGMRRKDARHHDALQESAGDSGTSSSSSSSSSSSVNTSSSSSPSASASPAAGCVHDASEAVDGDRGDAVAVSRRSDRVYAGVAVAAVGRRALFRQEQGLALQMEARVFDVPSCNGLLRGQMMLQALPSIVAAQVLSPPPGSTVLDMCAAPGGKSTLLGQLMGDRGRVVALDRTAAKVHEIQSLACDLGLTCVEAHKADSVEAVTGPGAAAAAAAAASAGQGQVQGSPAAAGELGSGPLGPPPYPPGSFSHVLLDPPCSALGLRPRLLHSWTLPQLRALAAYQRALLHTAVALLAPGGTLVYCTCTVNPDENEGNVAWALDRFRGQLQLMPAEPRVGSPGLTGSDPHTGQRWLTEAEAALVQRFDPGWPPEASMSSGVGGLAGLQSVSTPTAGSTVEQGLGGGRGREEEGQGEEHDDYMGFFIARFQKVV